MQGAEALEKLIKQAKAGRFGDNFIIMGQNAELELRSIDEAMQKLSKIRDLILEDE